MEIRKIPLSLVKPSPMNPRKTFDEADLQELADNIERQGLLQPITVRPIKDKTRFVVMDGKADFFPEYEIICGERRFRAFSKLSDKWSEMDVVAPKGESYNRFSDIPAIVREMNDDEAFDAMITENLQRKDVDPMEEAFAFDQLIQKGRTPEEVALRFGKSVRFVQDRVKLNNLIPELMLAIKDDKMSIAAAMIIAKLGEEGQRKFFSQYQHNSQGFTKSCAESYVNSLFLTIDKSLWYQSEDKADENFEGGCDRKCSECQLNTANHGCLFWEMKSQDAGRCTDREKFQSKTIAYMLSEIDKMGDNLVKKNQPLTKGKTVLFIKEEAYDSEDVKELKNRIRSQIEARDLEIVDQSMFRSPCYYNNDDERVAEFLKNGEVYPCLELFDWRNPTLKLKYWYVLKDDSSTNSDEDGVPFKVNKFLKDIKCEEDTLTSSLAVAGAEALNKCNPSVDSLGDEEMVMLLTCMLTNNFSLCGRLGLYDTSAQADSKSIKKWIGEHREKWPVIQLVWMFQQINGVHANLRAAEPILDSLGKKYCPEEYQKALDVVQAKFDKKKARAEKQLKELGYGLDGKPLAKEPETIKIPNGKVARQQYKEMKSKHPDSVLLFRVGDFYECFHEDAEKVADTLNLTLISNKEGKLAGFPHHALDTYLPKLIKSGQRIAICEQLEDPKKSKKGRNKQ